MIDSLQNPFMSWSTPKVALNYVVDGISQHDEWTPPAGYKVVNGTLVPISGTPVLTPQVSPANPSATPTVPAVTTPAPTTTTPAPTTTTPVGTAPVPTSEEVEVDRIATLTNSAQEQAQLVANDPQTAYDTAVSQANLIQNQLDILVPQLAAEPGLQTQIDTLITQLAAAETSQTQASTYLNTASGNAQRQVTGQALTDPGSLLQQADVVSTSVTPDQLIDPTTGQAPAVGLADTATADSVTQATAPDATPTATMGAVLVAAEAEGIIDATQAATGGPSSAATVQGQLVSLMEDFEGGATPIWASGAMRKAMQTMQARGMGASSVAGAAVVQAAMESALSIAQVDANTNSQFEMQNLSNVQQTTIFKTQQRMAALFADQSVTNAASQFNATSQNQTDQFFAGLEARASEFNAAQINGMRQFNASEVNAIEKFNTTLEAQRDQFNAQNSLVISQANAVWRQQVSTASTAAQNVANLEYTKNVSAITGAALDQIWQRERDLMDYMFQGSESQLDRANSVVLAKLGADSSLDAIQLRQDLADDTATSAFLANIVTGFLF